MKTRIVLAMLLTFLTVLSRLAYGADVWTDGNGDGLPDTSVPTRYLEETVTVDVWIDSQSFSWTAFQVWVEHPSGLAYDSAGYTVTGAANYPIDNFSNPTATGFAGIGYNNQGLTHIGWVRARIDSADTSCFTPIIDPANSYETFCVLSRPDTAIIFIQSTGSCFFGLTAVPVAFSSLDTSSVFGNQVSLLPCTAPPAGVTLKPEIKACQLLPARSGVEFIGYGFRYVAPPPGDSLAKNLPVRFQTYVADSSGNHFHHDASRPVASPVDTTGSTGSSGVFWVRHRWPEPASEYREIFFSLEGPPRNFNAQRDTSFNWCVRESVFVELVENPSLYTRTGGPDNLVRHRKHHWGTQTLRDGLALVATDFRDSIPGNALSKFNDMSLPWGGVFDADIDSNPDWGPPHCGHRFGRTCDVGIKEGGQFYSKDERNTYERIFVRRRFDVHKEGNHWHCTVRKPSQQLLKSQIAVASARRDIPLLPAGGRRPPLPASQSMTTVIDGATKRGSLSVTVTGSVTQQPSGIYQYSYSVTNQASSTDTIDTFALRSILLSPVVSSPQRWFAFYGYMDDPTALVWVPKELGAAPPGWVEDSLSVHVSEYAIVPGQTLSGFSFLSPIPPDTLQFVIKPWRDLPSSDAETDSPPDYWTDESVTGLIVGPGTDLTGVPQPARTDAPEESRLGPPSPNPASEAVSISFHVPTAAVVDIYVYDAAGRRIAGLGRSTYPAGLHHVSWDGRGDGGRRVASGIYFLELRVNEERSDFQRVAILH